MIAKICSINLNVAVQHFASVDLQRHRFPQLMGQLKSSFVLAVQIAR